MSNPVVRAVMVVPLGIFVLVVLSIVLLIASPEGERAPHVLLHFPGSFEKVKLLYQSVTEYNEKHGEYVFAVFVLSYLYKQAFSLPGSTILNVMAGALFGETYGTILCSVCAALGATLNYVISSYFFKGLAMKYFSHKIDTVKKMVVRHRGSSLFFYLLSLRVLPMMPNFLMNAIFPIVGIPIWQFFFSVLIGLLPYQYACVRSGLVIASVTSAADYDTFDYYDTTVELFVLGLLLMIPPLIMRRLAPPPLEPDS